ncbi:hypothetical protein [Nostoc sp.]|uniref:hypothetical protein n=1 Tax=Nostoc sp. TaxID=1180 RepID=UPI002FF81053
MIQTHGYADDRDDLPVFIHSELDDYGLDPYQFRVYARIARRAGRLGAYESIKNMAEGCCISEGKAKSSLRFLIEQGLVSRESREGYTSIYRLNPKNKWLPKKRLTGVDVEQPGSPGVHPPGSPGVHPPGSPGVHPPGSPGVHPPGSPGVHEGNPIKGSPIEINPVEGSPAKDPPAPHVIAVIEGGTKRSQIKSALEQILIDTDMDFTSGLLKGNNFLELNIPAYENNNQTQLAFSVLSQEEYGILKQAQAVAYNPTIAPWRINSTEFRGDVCKAVFAANPKWYSLADGTTNLKKINSQLKTLERKIRGSDGVSALEAYKELLNYVCMADMAANGISGEQILEKTEREQQLQRIHNASKKKFTL